MNLKLIKLFLIVFIIMVVAFPIQAGIKEDFFHAGLGAKSKALGGTAFAFYADSIFSNPAGLAVFPKNFLVYGYNSSFDNMVSNVKLAYSDTWNGGGWGIGLIRMDSGSIDKTMVDEFDRPKVIGSFSEVQTGLSAAFGLPLWGDSAFGLGVRYYNNNFDNEYANSLGLFAGYIKKINEQLLLGLSVNNFSISDTWRSAINWSTGRTDYFPLRLTASLAYRTLLYEKNIELFLDLHQVEINNQHETDHLYSAGCMIWLIPRQFALRGGLAQEMFALGAGFSFENFSIDYAYLNHQNLGVSHELAFGLLLDNAGANQ